MSEAPPPAPDAPATDAPLGAALAALYGELLDGPPASGAYMLNPGDAGLLRSLDRLSAADASAAPPGGSPVAAHVDHVRYGLSLLNRAAAGEDPFADADWSASWRRTTVTDAEWAALRASLADEAARWGRALAAPPAADGPVLRGMIGSVAHLAYHIGAVRQIARAARGPAAND